MEGIDQTLHIQSLDFLSHMSIYRKYFSCFLHNLKTIYEYKYMEKSNLKKTLVCSSLSRVFSGDVTYKVKSLSFAR